MNLLTRLDRKYGKYAIDNIMIYLIIGYGIMWAVIKFNLNFYLQYLSPDMSLIMKGEVWRLLSIIFLPPDFGRLLFLAINLYFLYFIGKLMENMWGKFSLNLFIISSYLMHIIGAFVLYFIFDINIGSIEGLLSGYLMFGSYYITMALFVLVGLSAPEVQVLLFFIIPIKMKWMAYLTIALLSGTVICGYGNAFGLIKSEGLLNGLGQIGIYPYSIPATSALICIIDAGAFYMLMRGYHVSRAQIKRKREYNKKIKISNTPKVHKCAVCGRTSEDESLSFRYCSKCNGTYEYCQDHLFTHEHIK